MKIAVEGCAHGELDNIYSTIAYMEEKEGFKVDLLICCGDFQGPRNEEDLGCIAVPPKYCNMCTFYKYYTGEKKAPILTIFIGGNHEASNYLQELPYGGWVAPNIYYMGYAGVINIAGIRIGGISGIYKSKDYLKGHFEHSPYNDETKRSVYHVRNLEVFRLKQISEPLNIFLSHDWPSGVWEYGNKNQLIRFKPFFERDMETGELGSKPNEELLHTLKPEYWFSAHLHWKFAALIPHNCGKITKFLALDKCLPKRRFLQIVDIPHNPNLKTEICYDLEWLTILRTTNHLLSIKSSFNYLPGPTSTEKWCFTPREEEKSDTVEIFGENLIVPINFEKTVEGYNQQSRSKVSRQPHAVSNPQTVLFCKKLQIDDPLHLILNLNLSSSNIEGATDLSLSSHTFIDSEVSIDNSLQSRVDFNFPRLINDLPNVHEDVENEGTKCTEAENRDSADQLIVEEKPDGEHSLTKKFKRRNQSIYENECD